MMIVLMVVLLLYMDVVLMEKLQKKVLKMTVFLDVKAAHGDVVEMESPKKLIKKELTVDAKKVLLDAVEMK